MIWSILDDLRVTIKILILFARWGSEVNGERNASQSARRCMSSDSMIEVDDSSQEHAIKSRSRLLFTSWWTAEGIVEFN